MRFSRLAAAGAAVPVLVLGMMSPAFADNIYNDLDGSIDAAAESMSLDIGGANGTTTLAITPLNGDGKNGCNLNQNNGQTLTVAVTSSDPLVATVLPASIVLTSCGATPVLTVTPVGLGTTSVTLSEVTNTTGATFDLAPAAFDVEVVVGNTAPTVTVSGVADGGSYNLGSVPTAMCDVVDAEDGNSSFAADLSAVTGPDAANGIGSQTASCEYTDGGGLTDTDEATYDITDATGPSVDYDLTPATPDGENGWWVSDVSVDWTVTEAESTSTLVLTDCDDFTTSGDFTTTTYTCSADSDGGHGEATTENIQVDATDPSVDLVDGPDDGATYFFGLETVPAAPTCDASDATSGINVDGCSVNGWSDQVGSHTVTASAKDNAGNTSSDSTSYEVVECNIDTSVIGSSVCAPKCDGVDATIKASSGVALGTAGDDVIVGSTGVDDIDGLGGNDLICAYTGVDSIDGGDGNDTIYGGELADTIEGGLGDDKILGGKGGDTITAGDGADELRGGLGNDTLTSGSDANGDRLVGEGGADTLTGGDGDDKLSGGPGADVLKGNGGADQLLGGGDADDMQGGAGEDILNGDTGNDMLDGGADADILRGESGDDTMAGGEGADRLRGGVGADVGNGGDGADFLYGGDDNDTLDGEAGNDKVVGNAGDDALFGGDDDDTLIGGPGTDTLDGGGGTNILLS